MPFDKEEENYQVLSCKLKNMTQGNKILTVHIPGTGGVAESNYPIKVAIDCFMWKKPDIPLLLLHGVGSIGKDYVAPVTMDTSSLSTKSKSITERFWDLATSKPDAFIASTAPTALVGGLVIGSGKEQHIERMINLLKALEEDGNLPDEIILSGFSRGAVAAHEMGNKIYMEFGNRIKLQYIVLDPVPGPGHGGDIYERIIPPNAVSYTVFFAPKEGNALLAANDLNTLVFTNKLTTITSFAVPETNHQSIMNSKLVVAASYSLVNAIHGESGELGASLALVREIEESDWGKNFWKKAPLSMDELLQNRSNPRDIKGDGARSNATFYYCSPVYVNVGSKLSDAIHTTRKLFDAKYLSRNRSSSFDFPEISTKKLREGFLKGTSTDEIKKIEETNKEKFKNKHSFFASLSAPPALSIPDCRDLQEVKSSPFILQNVDLSAFNEIKRIQDVIYDSIQGKDEQHIKYCDFSEKKGYIKEDQQRVLDLIRNAYEKAQGNPNSALWVSTLAKAQEILGMDEKAEQKSIFTL